MKPEQILKNFRRCDGWETRYLYLIELGQRLPPYPNSKMDDAHLVKGCQSNVWLTMSMNDGKIIFDAASDTLIVKGLIALTRYAFNDRTPSQAINFDINAWFIELGLNTHLTPGRQQGLHAIVEEIRHFANLHILS